VTRRPIVAAAALLLVGGLAACGSSDGDNVAAKTKATSSTSTSAPAVDKSPTGQALFASMTTAMAKAKTAKVSFSSKVADQQIGGQGAFRFSGETFAADLSVVLPGMGKARLILLPTALYLKLPTTAGLPAGKPWLEIRTDGKGEKNPLATTLSPLMDQLKQGFDPKTNFGILQATTTVKAAGTEVIDGVKTTKYTSTIDLAKAAGIAKGPLADQYRTLVSSGVKSMDYSIWVDGDNLPRKFSTVVPTTKGSVTATGTYRDWGKPITVKAPPRRQIATMPRLPQS
jgi:hypothetical protein